MSLSGEALATAIARLEEALASAVAAQAPAAAQAERLVAPILTTPDAVDSATFARPQVARVTHVDLDLALDFERKAGAGTAPPDVLARADAGEIVLDSNGLVIDRVTDGQGRALAFEVGDRVEGKGEPVTVSLGTDDGQARQVVIHYAANPQANALQWLAPEQTAGGEHPFLFSQGQAILNRGWIPTQDSPGTRQTWRARIPAPEPLDVVMSGVAQGEPEALGNGRRAFTFVMDKPVPPYLIAIAAGDIDFRAIAIR